MFETKSKNLRLVLSLLFFYVGIVTKIALHFLNILKIDKITLIGDSAAIIASFYLIYLLISKSDYHKKIFIIDFISILFFFSNLISGILLNSCVIKEETKKITDKIKSILNDKLPTNSYIEKKSVIVFIVLFTYGFIYEFVEVFPNITNRYLWILCDGSIILIPLLIIFRKELIESFKNLLGNFKKLMVFSIVILIITVIISNITGLIIQLVAGDMPTNQRYIESTFNTIQLFIAGVIVYPTVEELIFRGCLRKILKNNIIFIFLSGLLFGSIHIFYFQQSNPLQYLYLISYSITGMGLAYIYTRTKNIYTCILAHMLVNFVGLASTFLMANIIT